MTAHGNLLSRKRPPDPPPRRALFCPAVAYGPAGMTRYRVSFETADLITRALARIKQIEPIKAPRVATTVVELDISDAGVSADKQVATRARDVEPVKVLPDILAFLQKETELTRHTLAEILKRSGRLGEFKVNPQAFMAAVAKEISCALHDLMPEGLKYEKVAGQYWEMSRIEQDAEDGIVRYLSNPNGALKCCARGGGASAISSVKWMASVVQVGAASAAWTVTGEDDFPRNVRSSMPQLQNDLKKSALATRIRPNVLMISQLFMIRDVIPAKARGHMTLMRTIA
jgi:hypothetical protein